ncbi:MAG: phosphoribosylanthranilate isomerase [Deltaproteobacteria bacterium]|nr:phosphoribosylanthranilate isomerase [Deltaproteobacteria bacterium]
MKMNNSTLSPIIKICGLTSLEQALSCVELGADWLGLNCWSGSSRYITAEKALEIVDGLPESVSTVGVFVNESTDTLESIMRETGIDLAQLHGDETPENCKKITVPWFKAFRVSPSFQPQRIQDYGGETFLLDAYSKTHYGGSGQKIDWELASTVSAMGKLILAGGLAPENVADAVNKVRPWGVDVCSGVESEPGIKDLLKVKEFINNIRNSGDS